MWLESFLGDVLVWSRLFYPCSPGYSAAGLVLLLLVLLDVSSSAAREKMSRARECAAFYRISDLTRAAKFRFHARDAWRILIVDFLSLLTIDLAFFAQIIVPRTLIY